VHVIVTQKMIDNGLRGSCRYCPLALAFSKLPHIGSVQIWNREGVIIVNGKRRIDFRLSRAARRFVRNFDLGGPVKPVRFKAPAALSTLSGRGKGAAP
jgi:hypothetical protein